LRASTVFGRAQSADERRPSAAGDLEVGQKVSGYVVNSNDKGVFVALSRTVVGRIRLKLLSDQAVLKDAVARLHPPGELIRDITVTEVNKENGQVELSLRQGGSVGGKLTVEQLTVGDVVAGRVKAVEKYGIFVRLENSGLDGLVHRTEVSDTASVSLDSYKPGDKISRAKILKIEGQKIWLGVKASHFDEEEDEDEDDDDEEEAELAEEAGADGGAEAAEEANDVEAEGDDGEEEAPKAKRRKKEKAAVAKPAAAVVAADSDEEAPWNRAAVAAGLNGAASSAAFEFAEFKVAGQSSSEEEGEADGEEEGAEISRPSKRQKKAAKLAEAKELQVAEVENAEARWASDPKSIEDFERLLLTKGDTSIVWIRYMAFHLKMSDLVRARQVAERAVKHVGFAEAKERFNVWVAFMNLECTFGSEETANEVFKRASSWRGFTSGTRSRSSQ